MKYNSVDEIDTISFRDAAIVRCVLSAKQGILEFELDGAMVRENNSANELFSDRYVRDMQVRFVNPEVEAILLEGHKYYDANDDKQTWFNKIKELSGEMGFAKEVKEYKQNPDMYKAHVGDVSTVLRVALTGRTNTPDMYEIMNVLGKESIQKRFEKAIK